MYFSQIVDTSTGKSFGPNQKGELCIKGPQVMLGYKDLPTQTAETIDKDGWLHTYILCRVCELDRAYSLSYPLYNTWGCVFSVYPFPLWWLKEYILCLISIIKSEAWTITHCLGLGHETMVCAVCVYVFLWICHMAGLPHGTFVS